jgi:DNA-binding beta-propeller fold protein YncE
MSRDRHPLLAMLPAIAARPRHASRRHATTAADRRATTRGALAATDRRATTRGALRATTRGALAAALAAAAAVAGCGSTTAVGDLPRAAEPDTSPPLETRPAGRVVEVGNRPEGVVADPVTGLVAVGLRDPDELALVDGATGEVRRRVPLPGAPRHLGLAGPAGPVLVPTERGDALSRVALPGGAIDTVPVGAFPHDAVEAGGRIWAADEHGNTVSVVEGDDVRRIDVATQPGGVAAVDRGRRVAVVSVRERVLELYDSDTLERVGRAPAGAGPTHVVPGEGGLAYVVDTAGDGLLVFETRGRLRIVRRYPLLGAPYGVAADLRNGRLWVTLTERNEVMELATGSRPHRLNVYPTVRQPNTVAVDPDTGRAFVTGKVDGVLQLLDPRRSR